MALWNGCSPVNLLHVFRSPFLKNTSEGLLLKEILIQSFTNLVKPYLSPTLIYEKSSSLLKNSNSIT